MDRVGVPGGEAWHEAGHALVAHLLGGRVRRLSLEDEIDGLDGNAAIEWSTRDSRELASWSGRTALGGPLAELIFRGEDSLADPEVLASWDADWAEVETRAAELEPDGVERVALIRRWIDEVRALLDEPNIQERLARIADALDAHGALDEDLFDDCLR